MVDRMNSNSLRSMACGNSLAPRLDTDAPKSIDEGVDKKCVRRDIERERRRDMKSRYSSLRSLLPQENIMRKISISDELSEAADYIRHLQQKVDLLAKKRDVMRINIEKQSYKRLKIYNSCVYGFGKGPFPSVNVDQVGSCVVVTTTTSKSQMGLSKLLLAVDEEGLLLLSAASFANDGKVVHTLHCKLSDINSFNGPSQLHHKLWQLMLQNYIADDANKTFLPS